METGLLWDLERGRRELSLDLLVDTVLPAYLEALRATTAHEQKLTLQDLLALADILPTQDRHVVLAGPKSAEGRGQANRVQGEGVRYCSYLLKEKLGSSEVAISRVILDPGASAAGPFIHAHFGQEILYVIRGGPIEMIIERSGGEPEEKVRVSVNECLVFFSHRRHWAHNLGKKQAHYMVIRCPAHTPTMIR